MATSIRIGGYQGEKSVHTRAVRVLLRALEGRGGRHIDAAFEPDIAARGRKAADLLDLTASGALELCYFSSSYLGERVPALAALDVPFAFAETETTRARLEGGFGAVLEREVAARTPYRVLAFWDNGLRHLSNARRPLRRPEDCAGLRIRTLPSAGYHATFRALGMEPVTIDVRDLVRALASGEVDAQENPLANITQFALARFHPFVTMTAHFHGIALLLCNAAAWAGWTHDVCAMLADAAAQSTAAQWEFAAQEEIASRAELLAQGVHIVELDAAGRAAFRHAVRDVIAQQRAALSLELAALLPDPGA